jgi:mediator of RNA polymerase II transcription subunit 16, fungi type
MDSTLVWSNNGSIAHVSRDGRKISFSALFRDQKTGRWNLNESNYAVDAPPGKLFVHIQFNGLGLDLAAVDSEGGVHLYSLAGSINRLHQAHGEYAAGRGDIDQIVGMHWLRLYPNEFGVSVGTPLSISSADQFRFQAPYITPVTRAENGRWPMSARTINPHVPKVCTPDRRNAIFHVTRGGRLTLLHQNEQGVWQATCRDLELASDDLLSHAAFGEKDDNLILVTHDTKRRLRVFRITVNWNQSQPHRGGPVTFTAPPTLSVGHITAIDHISPQQPDTACLSILHVVSPPPTIVDSAAASVAILAVYTYTPLPTDPTQAHRDAYSCVARWSLETTVPSLHPAFDKLKSNGANPAQTSPITTLRRAADIYSAKLILSVRSQFLDTIVCFLHSDGTIEYRDRATFDVLMDPIDTKTASCPAQTGFINSAVDHRADVASSPDGSFVVATKHDGKLEAIGMAFRSEWQHFDMEESQAKESTEAGVVSLARQYVFLGYSTWSRNEVLATLLPTLGPDMHALFVQQVIRIMCRQLDMALLDHQRQASMSIKEARALSVAMSAQLVLGTKAGSTERTLRGKFAYISQNHGAIGMALALWTSAAASNPNPQTLARTYLDAPSLAGPVKWLVSSFIYILGSLMEVKLRIGKTGASPLDAFTEYSAENDNPSIQLLLCSVTRAVIRSLFHQFLHKFTGVISGLKDKAANLADRQVASDLYDFYQSLPFSIGAVIEMLLEFDSAVRNAYTSSGISAETRVEIEIAIITEGAIPTELVPALNTLAETILPKIADHPKTDNGKLYFWDTKWLGIERPPKAGEKEYDAARKTPLRNGVKLRVCRRCGAHMEDIPQEALRQLPQWLHTAQRHCYCGDYWWVE